MVTSSSPQASLPSPLQTSYIVQTVVVFDRLSLWSADICPSCVSPVGSSRCVGTRLRLSPRFPGLPTPYRSCLAREEDTKNWLKNTEQCEELNSLHICFHFGVCFQRCARKYGVPKCGLGCSDVVIWHNLIYRMSLYPLLILI